MFARYLCYFLFPLAATAQAVSFLPPSMLQEVGALLVSGCSRCVAVADFNGDGKADIAFNIQAPMPDGSVLLGNGDGTFQHALALQPKPGNVFVGDFNGDGKPDLMIAQYSTYIYSGKGDGTFGGPVEVSSCEGSNRDGKTDLLCGTSVQLSNGDGTFGAAGVAGSQAIEAVLLVADFNKDETPDVFLRQAPENSLWFWARVTGRLGMNWC